MPRIGGRSLLVSSHFQPMRGGSAVVYDQLCRHAPDRITVLSAARDYATDQPIPGVREFDETAPYRIVRVPLLRAPDRPATRRAPSGLGRLSEPAARLLIDIPILVRTLVVTAWVSLVGRITVVCIGDLISLGWMVWPLRRVLRRKGNLFIHGEEVSVHDASFFLRLRRRVLAQADAVVAVSSFTRDLLVSRMGVPQHKIAVIANAVDETRFHPGPADPAVIGKFGTAGRRVVLSVGRLIERKGFDRLIEAMPRVIAAVPDVLCLIAGDGPMRAQLSGEIERLGLAAHVRLLGQVGDADLLALYRIAELFAMPNRTTASGDAEGFGLVFLEANACGKPVVAGRSGGVVDAVTDGVNGLLVDGESTAEIATALIVLLSDGALYARLAAGALALARANGWESRAQSYIALCERLEN